MLYINPFLTSLVGAVRKAASYLDRDFNEIEKLQSSVRGSKNFVFNTYARLETRLKEEIGKLWPDTPMITQQSKINGDTYFALSPIEGIINFAHGNPNFALTVAYIEKGEIMAGVVYNPVLDEMFFAFKGNGAYKEGARSHERLRVSATKELEGASLSALAFFDKEPKQAADFYAQGMLKTGNLHISGCLPIDLAYLAAGKQDVALCLNAHICALAAGILLVKESGGVVRALSQKDNRSENLAEIFQTGCLAASNYELRQKVFENFKKL